LPNHYQKFAIGFIQPKKRNRIHNNGKNTRDPSSFLNPSDISPDVNVPEMVYFE